MSFKDRIPSQKSYKFLLWFLTAAFMVLSGAQLLGQLEAGKISGTVRDTSGLGLEFRAEGFNVFNHHNYYVNPADLLYSGPNSSGAYATTPLSVTEEKGGLGALATGGNHDERRFGQFSLRAIF